ncbi:hypothetical protein P3342_001480 [Pyrenophora teres f. teres]|nr:hypothetical protein P3342_001480 [Pyrenophora teres f. teres]
MGAALYYYGGDHLTTRSPKALQLARSSFETVFTNSFLPQPTHVTPPSKSTPATLSGLLPCENI